MDSNEDVPLSEFLKKVENDIKRKRNCVHSGEEKRQKLSDLKSRKASRGMYQLLGNFIFLVVSPVPPFE